MPPATADDGNWDTGTIAGNSTGTVTMLSSGTMTYHCTIHPQMTGTVVVTADATPPTDTLTDQPTTRDGGSAWVVPALAALGGPLIAGRRFGRRRTGATIGD